MALNSRRSPAAGGPHRDPTTGLEESMRQLGWRNDTDDVAYSERLGKQDCSYFIRTGTCSYGEMCRYNHPRDSGVATNISLSGSGYPERVGQPVCEYFLKNGTCRYGAVCKYHHPRGIRAVSLNYNGYPLRPGEEKCSYYVRTGQCKFGSVCKFDHPEPVGSSVPSTTPVCYPMVQPPLVPTPQQYPSSGCWQVGYPSVSASSCMPGHYSSMLINMSQVPYWSTYLSPASSLLSPVGQQMFQATPSYEMPNHYSPSKPAQPLLIYPPFGPSNGHQKEYMLQDGSWKAECQHYMRTGVCKFGAMCNCHHRPDWCALSPLGLPLRVGAQPCPYYAQNGVCNFGPTCKYDHRVGTISYSPSVSSLSEVPIAPYPAGFSC